MTKRGGSSTLGARLALGALDVPGRTQPVYLLQRMPVGIGWWVWCSDCGQLVGENLAETLQLEIAAHEQDHDA